MTFEDRSEHRDFIEAFCLHYIQVNGPSPSPPISDAIYDEHGDRFESHVVAINDVTRALSEMAGVILGTSHGRRYPEGLPLERVDGVYYLRGQ